LNRLLAFFSHQRRAILAALVCLVGAGIWIAFQMPAAILPEVVFPRITVLADSGEMPAADMVREVTRPLEESLRRVTEIQEIRSVSSRGSAEIQLDCDWHANMNRVLQLVQAQVDATRGRLPDGATVEARLMSPVQFPILGFSLTSPTRSLAELRDLAVYQLKPELARLPGIADVVIQGGQRPEARVTLDPRMLEARRLDPVAIRDALQRAGSLASLGLLEANRELYLMLADARPTGLEELRAVPVAVDSGPSIPLGALGKVEIAPAPEFTRYAAGAGQAVLINLLRTPSASTIQISRAAHQWFQSHSRAIPKDVHVETFYDQAELVHAAVGSVRDSLLIGALMAILIVLWFLRSVRLGLAGALVLPGSLALTIVGLALTHQTLNLMTLGGIAAAVGLVLDDAIVVVEHIAHRAAGTERRSIPDAVAEIAPALVGSSLCTIAIFFPFAYLSRVTGAFFRVLALSMTLMLTASLVLCLVVLPWLRIGRARERAARKPGRFSRTLATAVAHDRWALLIAVLLVAAIVPLRATLGSGFLPEMDEGSLIMDFVAPAGLSVDETDQILKRAEREIGQVPEIVEWSRRQGDQLGFFITEPNMGDYTLRLRPHRRRSAEQIADDLRERIARTEPRLELEFGQLIEDVVGDLTTSPEPIEVRVLGEDRDVDERRAEQIAELLPTIRGVVDVKSGVVESGPNLSIVPGPAARRAGLGPQDLADRTSPYVQGLEAGAISRGSRSWPVRITFPNFGQAQSPRALLDARVPLTPERWVRLGDLASVHVQPGETEIARDNLRTMVAATGRLTGRDLGSAMHEIQRRIASGIALPPGTSVEYAGLWSEQQTSFRSLALVLVGSATAVLILLLVSFRSWGRAGAALLVAIAALAGVLAALHVGGATLNIASFVGAIMVVGIVAENAYFLVVTHSGGLAEGLTPREAAIAAAQRRARPILMTCAAGVAALAPLAIGLGAGSDLLRPLAIAVIGGFVASAPLLLLVLPALLARVDRGAGS
jgi:multidrug efflux pump subunit AcrB